LEGKKSKVLEWEKETHQPDFWNDNEKAQRILKQISLEKKWIEKFHDLFNEFEEIVLFAELAEKEKDQNAQEEAQRNLEQIQKKIDEFEFESTLSGEDDPKNALLIIHSGAGGTESQDWASMLLRMYCRFIERKGFKYEIIDYLAGEEAGIKSATLEVTGEYAYGFLKAESGVHRLVRISPFDANKRRHTSFASVFVYPEIEDNITVEIKDEDIRVDTFRASGAGGQHVNKTSSAVRITHIPTGIVVQCQTERSQHKNKESALKVLRSRLYQLYQEKENEKMEKMEKSKKKIEWGSQIRSYVFHPYNMVKDHRTDFETSDTQKVMDGEIDGFIKAFLSHRENSK
jgi:peptide chain release factor 2